jgi:hypothetical protein
VVVEAVVVMGEVRVRRDVRLVVVVSKAHFSARLG